MKRIEKMAVEYAGEPGNPWYKQVPLDNAVVARSSFEAGFRAAREMAGVAAARFGTDFTRDPLMMDILDAIYHLGEEEVE